MEFLPIAVPAALVLTLLGGGPAPGPAPRSCTSVLGAEVCTSLLLKDGQAVGLEATIPMALIDAVPADAPMVWPPAQLASIPLPAEAKAAFGIDHLAISWEAHGHPPALFMTPHFDFHFYTETPADVQAIDCSDQDKPGTLPTGYVLPDISVPQLGTLVGLCVPKMGMHAVTERETRQTDPFRASLLVGYYGGRPIFFEPMVSRAALLAKQDFALSVPEVAHLPAGVRYPRSVRAVYDAAGRQYRLALTGFGSGPARLESDGATRP